MPCHAMVLKKVEILDFEWCAVFMCVCVCVCVVVVCVCVFVRVCGFTRCAAVSLPGLCGTFRRVAV